MEEGFANLTRSVYLCILLANAGNPPDLTRISPKCGGEGEGLKAEGKLLRKCVPITQAGEEGRRKEGTHICLIYLPPYPFHFNVVLYAVSWYKLVEKIEAKHCCHVWHFDMHPGCYEYFHNNSKQSDCHISKQ